MAPKKKTREEILERKRQLEKIRYQRIKHDAEKSQILEQKKKEYYIKEKREGKIKNIDQLTPRCQRAKRKQWRENTAKYKEKQRKISNQAKTFMQNATPPDSDTEVRPTRQEIKSTVQPQQTINYSPVHRRVLEGRRRAERNRRQENLLLKKKDETIDELKTQLKKYQKLLSKIKCRSSNKSPTAKVNKIIKGDVSEIKKKLLFG